MDNTYINLTVGTQVIKRWISKYQSQKYNKILYLPELSRNFYFLSITIKLLLVFLVYLIVIFLSKLVNLLEF